MQEINGNTSRNSSAKNDIPVIIYSLSYAFKPVWLSLFCGIHSLIDSARMNESLMNQISVYFELHDLEKDSEGDLKNVSE